MTRTYQRGAGVLAAAVLVAAIAACGSDTTGPNSGSVTLARSSGDSQTVVANAHAASPIAVLVTKGGAPQPGVAVTWAMAGGTGTLDPATSTTDANGVATTSFTASTVAHVDSVRASASGSSMIFIVTVTGDPSSAKLTAAVGDGIATLAGYGVTLTAKAVDAYGNAIAGVPVSFSVDAGILSATSVSTNSDGNASTQYTPPAKGAFVVHATSGSFAPVTFTVNAN